MAIIYSYHSIAAVITVIVQEVQSLAIVIIVVVRILIRSGCYDPLSCKE
jgi:hypothetical protein